MSYLSSYWWFRNVWNLFQAGCSILERSAINPAPDVTDNAEEEYSSGGEEEGTVPSPGGADYDEESREVNT